MSDDIRRILEKLDAAQGKVKQLPALFKPKDTSPQLAGPYPGDNATRGYLVGEEEDQSNKSKDATTEDMVSSMKKKLGDYLQDVATAIRNDSDLKDKGQSGTDQLVSAVKTVRTDDGHEIKIHGNEDDGFRVSIRDRDLPTKFKNLDEAAMACEMYCARRRNMMQSRDYVDEA